MIVANEFQGKKIAFLAADGVEQVEPTEPRRAVAAAAAEAHLISIASEPIQGINGMVKGDTFPVDATVDAVMARDDDGLVLPDGVPNPDKPRLNPRAVEFVRFFSERAKPAAAVCHDPWTLVEADVGRGRTLTAYPSLLTDIRNAGGTWVDGGVHVTRGS